MKLLVAIALYVLLCRGSCPKPWTEPGYGKRRNAEWVKRWMGRPL